MKRIIYKLAVLTFTAGIILVSFLTKSASEENNSNFTATTAIPDTQFIISCYDNGVFNMYNTITDSLHFNTWHQYTKPEMGWNYDTTDNYLADTTQYKGLVTSQIAGNKTHGMRTIMSRPVIMYVGAGQRIDYQCENVGQGEAYWFWAYKYSLDNNDNINDFQDNSQYGKGEMVKQCISSLPENYSETLIDSGLRSNRELSFTQTNWYLSDTAWDWYIMPRIRIDSAYAAGTAHNEDTVCQIMLTGWRGDTVKNILIKIINFKNNPSAPYNGIYLDSFFFSSGQTDLTIPKDTVIKYFLPQNPGWTFDWSRTCLMCSSAPPVPIRASALAPSATTSC